MSIEEFAIPIKYILGKELFLLSSFVSPYYSSALHDFPPKSGKSHSFLIFLFHLSMWVLPLPLPNLSNPVFSWSFQAIARKIFSMISSCPRWRWGPTMDKLKGPSWVEQPVMDWSKGSLWFKKKSLLLEDFKEYFGLRLYNKLLGQIKKVKKYERK